MKSLARVAPLLIAALTLASTARAADPDFSAVGPKMQTFVDTNQIAGIVTLVADKDKVLFLNAVGTSDFSRKMETNDIFWIASMSKPITALCAAILVDDGKLKFDDPVEKYIPEFKDAKVGGGGRGGGGAGGGATTQASRPITVRDLLTHTAGTPDGYTSPNPHWTLEQFAKNLAAQPLRFQPGSRWSYSTAGIDAVGRIVEVASGMPFDQFMQKRLLDPLAMKDTSFWVSAENEKRYAHPYRLNAQTNKFEDAPIGYLYGSAITDRQRPPLGGAGLFSTAEDICKVYQMALNKGTFNGHQILKPETLAEMTKNQIGALTARPGMPWGYGFCVITDPNAFDANKPLSPGTFGHGGAFGTSSWADPTRGIVYIQMLERNNMGNPDNSPMHIAFDQVATEAITKK